MRNITRYNEDFVEQQVQLFQPGPGQMYQPKNLHEVKILHEMDMAERRLAVQMAEDEKHHQRSIAESEQFTKITNCLLGGFGALILLLTLTIFAGTIQRPQPAVQYYYAPAPQ